MTDRLMMSAVVMLFALLLSAQAGAQAVALINMSRTEGLSITMNSQVTPIPLNQMHSWVMTLRTPDDEAVENASIQIDGGMPLHNHGLATRPQVTDYLGDGRYLVEGLRFHMPGDWLLDIQIEHQGRRYHSEATFTL